MSHTLYVYGTLRPGGAVTHLVPGELYELGWYPGLKLLAPDSHSWVVTERIEVDDEQLSNLDTYEGYDPEDELNSLYLRRPYLGGWIYVYNSKLEGRRLIESGDWLAHRESKSGTAADKVIPKTPVVPEPDIVGAGVVVEPATVDGEMCA